MPEEVAPDEIQDTPEVTPDDSGPVDGTPAEDSPESTPATDWEKRYSDLRPEYDRTNQRLSEYEQFIGALQDPQRQGEALRAFGIELEDDEDTFDEDETWENRFERIEQSLQAQQQAAQQAELAQLEEAYMAQELQKLDPDRKFSDRYVRTVTSLAYEYADRDGVPDFEAAHKELQEEIEEQRKGWVQSKKAPQVQSGAAASHQPDLDDREQRRAHMAEKYAKSIAEHQ